jgi:asparagine N-glycosylation enzyme membrane subunit Stt3
VRDFRSMPLIYLLPIALALAFPAVVALDGGRMAAVLVWWPLAALGALSLADKPRTRRILLTVLMSVVCLLLAIVWLGGQLMLPALLALFVIDMVRAASRTSYGKVRHQA